MCHATDCFFCLSKKSGIGKSLKWTYPNVASVTFPLPHSNNVPYPAYPNSALQTAEMLDDSLDSGGSEFEPCIKQQVLTQAELNDWVRDFGMTKEKAELFASRMKQRGFLAAGVKTSIYRNRHEKFAKYYTKTDKICFCTDILGLFKELHETHDPKEWRLFIDSNKESLKAVLLHNGNEKPSIPVAHAVNSKENYETLEAVLKCIQYEKYEWKICADLKVVAILSGLQGGYTRFCCFLCLWNSRADKLHYIQKEWTPRTNLVVGEDNIQRNALVRKENIILPPLHIKLGLIKNFAKKLNKDGEAFAHLRLIFPQLSFAKIKEGVFAGPEIKKLLKDERFPTLLSPIESAAWNSFNLVVQNFLGNHKSSNFKQIVEDLIKNYEAMGMFYLLYIWYYICIRVRFLNFLLYIFG